MDFPAEFEDQFKDVDLPAFPGPMVYDTRQMYSPGGAPGITGLRQEFGELKQPEIIGWTQDLGHPPRPTYAVPGFLRDPTYYARKERRDHIVMLLEMRRYVTRVFDFKTRKTIDAAIARLEERPV